MPVLSHLHQLFNAEQCHAYIHTLRWKDRPLQCPRCQSHHIGRWGTYQYRPGCKRHRCHSCKRTFNDRTETLLHQSKRSLPYWILATFLLCLACSSRRIARELGVHSRTSYRWCWWLRNAALSYEMDRQLEGTVEADDLYHTAGNKGQVQGGGKKSLGRPRVGAGRSASPVGVIMTKTGPRLFVGQSPGGGRPPGDQRFHGEDGAEGGQHRGANGQSALHGLGQQLLGGEGLYARVRQSYAKGIGVSDEKSRRVSLFVAEAESASVSWCEQRQLGRVCRVLSVPTELSSTQCVRAGRIDLAGGLRSVRGK